MHSPSNHVAACPLKTPGRPSSSNTQHDNAWAHVKTSDCRASLPSGAAVTSSSVLPPRSGCDQSHAVFFHRATSKGFQTASVWKPSNCFPVTVEGFAFQKTLPRRAITRGFASLPELYRGVMVEDICSAVSWQMPE